MAATKSSKAAVIAVLIAGIGGLAAAADGGRTVVNPQSQYPEGPVVDGGDVYYAEMGSDRVMRWDGATNTAVWSRPGCGPTSVARGTDGTLIVLCDIEQVLARIDKTGKTLAIIDRDSSGRRFLTPNASINDAHGGIYWSASGVFSPKAPVAGGVLYLAADGTLSRLADGIHYSNGVALSPDGKVLYVSEHLARRILAYDVAAEGTLSGTRVFLRLDDVVGKDPARGWEVGPDGLAMDHAGNLYIAEYGGGHIVVVGPDAKLKAVIGFPQPFTTAVALMDDDRKLFVTAPASYLDPKAEGAVYLVDNPLFPTN